MKVERIGIALPEIGSEHLNRMARGYQISQILFTAIEYDVFTLLSEPKTATHISTEIKTDPKLTEKFLNALVALRLLSKSGDKYAITTLARTFLVKDSPFYQGNLLKLTARGYYDWSKLGQALKSGSIQKEQEKKFEHINKVFTLGHAEGAMRGDLLRAISAIVSLPEFKNAKRLLDLGGGHGLYAIAFAQINPNLNISIFDLPHVIEITKEFIKKYRMENKIKVIAGDFTKDELGNDYDIIFVSDVTIFDVLKKIYHALKEDGVLIYRRWTLNDDGTAPLTSVLFDLMLSIYGSEHRVCTLSEYISSIEKAGFSIVWVIDISTSLDPAKIIVAKKGVR
jgi:SAM-dependent methyltransferase